MLIGLDLDNTIVCYDRAIRLLADKLHQLPSSVPRTKLGLRDFLRTLGREEDWTAFQGELYGPGMKYAQPFNGAISAMQMLKSQGHDLAIVSHRSRRPYAGKSMTFMSQREPGYQFNYNHGGYSVKQARHAKYIFGESQSENRDDRKS